MPKGASILQTLPKMDEINVGDVSRLQRIEKHTSLFMMQVSLSYAVDQKIGGKRSCETILFPFCCSLKKPPPIPYSVDLSILKADFSIDLLLGLTFSS